MRHHPEVFRARNEWQGPPVSGKTRMRCLPAVAAMLLLPGVLAAQNAAPTQNAAPAAPALATAQRGVVIASEKAASDAGLAVLRRGGSAADAAIAAALVLTVVAPQSASPGGVAGAVTYRAREREVEAWDGSATAPAAAGSALFLDRDGKPMPPSAIRPGGRAVGVPGMMRLLETLHRAQGNLTWAQLAAPAIELADKGFTIPPALARALAETSTTTTPERRGELRIDLRNAVPPGAPPPTPPPTTATTTTATTTRLRNAPLAEALRMVAASGADAVLRGPVAIDIATTVRNDPTPGLLTADDLAAYTLAPQKPLCTPYRGLLVCSLGAPSLGGVDLVRSLAVLDRANLPRLDPAGAQATTMLLGAWRSSRTANAANLADSEFAPNALATLMTPNQLTAEARLLEQPPKTRTAAAVPPMLSPETSSVMVLAVDGDGNAVSLSLSLHSAFGARLLVRGFALNDALAGFAPLPNRDGVPLANRVEGGKRPLEGLAPVVVVDPRGRLRFVAGAEGGEDGAALTAQMLLHVIDFHQSPSAAASAPVWRLRDDGIDLEDGVGARLLADLLRQGGPAPRIVPRISRGALVAWFESGAEGAPTMPAEMGFGRQ